MPENKLMLDTLFWYTGMAAWIVIGAIAESW